MTVMVMILSVRPLSSTGSPGRKSSNPRLSWNYSRSGWRWIKMLPRTREDYVLSADFVIVMIANTLRFPSQRHKVWTN